MGIFCRVNHALQRISSVFSRNFRESRFLLAMRSKERPSELPPCFSFAGRLLRFLVRTIAAIAFCCRDLAVFWWGTGSIQASSANRKSEDLKSLTFMLGRNSADLYFVLFSCGCASCVGARALTCRQLTTKMLVMPHSLRQRGSLSGEFVNEGEASLKDRDSDSLLKAKHSFIAPRAARPLYRAIRSAVVSAGVPIHFPHL